MISSDHIDKPMNDPKKSDDKLNPKQRAASDSSHTKPAIVTASAGTGKTTLLVDRVVRLLSDPSLNIKADSLAIMTFTRNATKSLREKLNKALNQKLAKSVGDMELHEYLSDQLVALRQAYISTIDSFCLRIIRENPESFDLPLNFSMADPTKRITMQLRAAELAMKDFYNEDPVSAKFSAEERNALFCTFNFEKDEDLQKAVMQIENQLSTYDDAEGWIQSAIDTYSDIHKYGECYAGLYLPMFEDYVKQAKKLMRFYDYFLGDIANRAEERMRAEDEGKARPAPIERKMQTFTNNTITPVTNYINADKARFEVLFSGFEAFKNAPDTDTLFRMIEDFRDSAKITVESTFKCGITGLINDFKDAKKSASKIADTILKFKHTNDSLAASFPVQSTAVCAFMELLKLYRNYYSEIKTGSGYLDFSDCELLLMEKLIKDKAFCDKIAERFTCVIVDEFQDSNDIQARIFELIGKEHLFYVGDVKQSIYGFRGGNPKIMAALCEEDNNNPFTVFPLTENYRSRKSVIDTANAAFRGLMTKEYGGIDYDTSEHILECSAKLPDIPDEEKAKYFSEIRFIGKPESGDKFKELYQPRAAARRIKELCEDKNFKISKNGKLVSPKYSDFTILTRRSDNYKFFRMALAELGIPSVVPAGDRFFDTDEISLLLDHLIIVDNPQRDEEMLRVMMSPIYRFNAEEMARLRLGLTGLDENALSETERNAVITDFRSHSLYGCVRTCAKEKFTVKDPFDSKKTLTLTRIVDPKLAAFFESIQKFRSFMSTNSIYRLVCKICEDTDILSTAAAFDDNAQRIANIRKFRDMAADFETRDGGSLNDFLRYIEYAKSLKDLRIEEANCPEGANAVKIMTFHKSKGLEFPVCILCELERKTSSKDREGTLLINRKKFVAMKCVDRKKRTVSKNFAYEALEKANRVQSCSEELRLLYVAMTRAQDKMIMFVKDKPEKWISDVLEPSDPRAVIEKTESDYPFKWIFASLMRHYNIETENFDPSIGCEIIEDTGVYADPDLETTEEDYEPEFQFSEEEIARLADKIGFTYKSIEDTTRREKFSVTELSHKASPWTLRLDEPDFIKKGDLTGSERGTAYHKCMEILPLDEFRKTGQDKWTDIIDRAIIQSDKLSAEEKSVIDRAKIKKFLESDLGERMLKSKTVVREKSFLEKLDAAKIGYGDLGVITLQGVIDLYFVEDDGKIVVVDYKTDTRANLEKERENYEKQVSIYSTVLPSHTGISVKETYLYTFSDNQIIKI